MPIYRITFNIIERTIGFGCSNYNLVSTLQNTMLIGNGIKMSSQLGAGPVNADKKS